MNNKEHKNEAFYITFEAQARGRNWKELGKKANEVGKCRLPSDAFRLIGISSCNDIPI